MIGSGDELSAPENAYPFMKWNSGIKSAKWEGDKLNVQPNENLTAEIAEGITFQGK